VPRLPLLALALFLLVGLTGVRWDGKRSALEWISGASADATSPVDRLLPPLALRQDGTRALLGTDEVGRSLGLRLGVALGTSLAVAGLGALVALILGTAWGTMAALGPAPLDGVMMRTAEATAGVPAVVVIMVLAAALKAWGLPVIFAAMGLLYWQGISRVVRAQVLRLRAEQWMEAARCLGLPWWRRLGRHLLPAAAPTVLTQGALLLPRLVMLEAFLSFVGVSSAAHSFGRIVWGVTATLTPLSPHWWPVLIPCALLVVFLVVLNRVLDDLGSALAEPRIRPA